MFIPKGFSSFNEKRFCEKIRAVAVTSFPLRLNTSGSQEKLRYCHENCNPYKNYVVMVML